MSRAFTREDTNEQPLPMPERPVSAAPNLVTPRGAQLIEERVRQLETQLSHGPDEAVARELRYWAARRSNMQIVAGVIQPDTVGFGSYVTLERGGKTIRIQIVGEDEADPAAGRIGWTAPLARAIDGATAGETVELELGARTENVKVLRISAHPES